MLYYINVTTQVYFSKMKMWLVFLFWIELDLEECLILFLICVYSTNVIYNFLIVCEIFICLTPVWFEISFGFQFSLPYA